MRSKSAPIQQLQCARMMLVFKNVTSIFVRKIKGLMKWEIWLEIFSDRSKINNV